jgi:hypothetical protein
MQQNRFDFVENNLPDISFFPHSLPENTRKIEKAIVFSQYIVREKLLFT